MRRKTREVGGDGSGGIEGERRRGKKEKERMEGRMIQKNKDDEEENE